MRYYRDRDTELQLDRLLNNGLDFNDNFRGGFVEILTTGGVETIRHNLGHVPIGWLIIFKDSPVEIYAEDEASWTAQTISLRSSVSNVTVRLFVM